MRKFVGFLLLAVTVFVNFCGCGQQEEVLSKYLRIHIRADSNEAQSQSVKLAVRDDVVKYLTPHLACCDTKEKAMNVLKRELDNLKDVCDFTLKNGGFNYSARVSLIREHYPTRDYEGFTLESGLYDSLVIELGEGKGDNWWCVIYPPLCFTGGENNGSGDITYKSKIAEIIDKIING